MYFSKVKVPHWCTFPRIPFPSCAPHFSPHLLILLFVVHKQDHRPANTRNTKSHTHVTLTTRHPHTRAEKHRYLQNYSVLCSQQRGHMVISDNEPKHHKHIHFYLRPGWVQSWFSPGLFTQAFTAPVCVKQDLVQDWTGLDWGSCS